MSTKLCWVLISTSQRFRFLNYKRKLEVGSFWTLYLYLCTMFKEFNVPCTNISGSGSSEHSLTIWTKSHSSLSLSLSSLENKQWSMKQFKKAVTNFIINKKIGEIAEKWQLELHMKLSEERHCQTKEKRAQLSNYKPEKGWYQERSQSLVRTPCHLYMAQIAWDRFAEKNGIVMIKLLDVTLKASVFP